MSTTPSPQTKKWEKIFEKITPSLPYYVEREEAFQAFQTFGIPTPKTENYRKSPIPRLVTNTDFMPPHPTVATQFHQGDWKKIPQYVKAPCYHVVFVNGWLNTTLTNLPAQHPFLQLTTLQEGSPTQQKFIKESFKEESITHLDPFTSLNGALFDQGYCLHIKDNVAVDRPICIYTITMATKAPLFTMPRLSIIVGENSKATLIQSSHSIGDSPPNLVNSTVTTHVGKNGQLSCYHMQDTYSNNYHINTANVYQAGGSSFTNYTFTLGSQFVRNNLTVTSQGDDTATHLYGLYALNGKDHVDNHVQVKHLYPHTYSKQHYKGILGGEATAIFNGKIYVASTAQKTNAFQTNNTLLLTDSVSNYAQPQLEIYADDVKCSHGATTGQLDQAQLFYLRSRGISEQEGRQLLLQAFAGEIIRKVDLSSLQEYLYLSSLLL